MKRTLTTTLAIFLFLLNCHAQYELSENQKLFAAAKVWGFLKYYHPHVAKGKFDWDAELFKKLPLVQQAKNSNEISGVFIDWIDELGKVEVCKKCEAETGAEYFDKNFDLGWIDDEDLFTDELSDKLRFIEVNRHQGKKYYVKASKRIGNVEITNEEKYLGFDWQDENLRLLSLFRYWNIIEYFFPYKYQTDIAWDQVFLDMLPKFLNPKTELDFHLSMLELVVSVDDSHAGFSSDVTRDLFAKYWFPARVKIIEGKAVVTWIYDDSIAEENDVKIGDVIMKINGKSVSEVFKEYEKYTSGSNISRKKYLAAYYHLLNGSSDSVKIEYDRSGKTASKTVARYLYEDFNTGFGEQEAFRTIDGNIGYVDMGEITANEIAEAMMLFKDSKGIILDLRNYPKETLYSITNYISSTNEEFYRKIYPDLNYPGRFIWESGGRHYREDGELEYHGRVVLLVNEASQSFAEFTAMCIQTGDNVTTIGSQTSGADGNTSAIPMVGGHKTRISGIGVFYPDGTETQRKGVKIDIEVKPTIQGIIGGRDEVLDRAIEFLNNEEN